MTGWPIASDSFGADQPGENVGRAARRVRHDDRDLLGEILRQRWRLRRNASGGETGKHRRAAIVVRRVGMLTVSPGKSFEKLLSGR